MNYDLHYIYFLAGSWLIVWIKKFYLREKKNQSNEKAVSEVQIQKSALEIKDKSEYE